MNDGQETDREAGEAAYELYEKWTNGQRKSSQTKEGMCTCTTACIQRHTSRDISLCRIAAIQPFVEESAGQAPKVARPGERPIDSTPDLADPVSVEAAISELARRGALRDESTRRRIRWALAEWHITHGTKADGLRAAAQICRKMDGYSAMTCADEIEREIAALAERAKT